MARKFCCGQSTIEFTAMTILIIVGILAMGKYMLGSINSYFKSADDQIHDSLTENILQTDLLPEEQAYTLGP